MQAQIPQFIFEGHLTEAGQQVQAYIEQEVNARKHDAAELNKLPGHVKHYHVNVVGTRNFTAEQYFEAFPNTARQVWNDMQYTRTQEQTQKVVEETAATTNALSEELARLREEFMALKDENTKLREQITAAPVVETVEEEVPAKPVKKTSKAKETDETPDAETPAEEESAE